MSEPKTLIKSHGNVGAKSNSYVFIYKTTDDEEVIGTVTVMARDPDVAHSLFWKQTKIKEDNIVFVFEVKGNPGIKVLP